MTNELCCSSITTSLLFYPRVLGFTIQYQREKERFARIMLEEISKDGAGRAWISGPLEVPFGRGINFEIKTSNVDELYERVQTAGAHVFLPIEEK